MRDPIWMTQYSAAYCDTFADAHDRYMYNMRTAWDTVKLKLHVITILTKWWKLRKERHRCETTCE